MAILQMMLLVALLLLACMGGSCSSSSSSSSKMKMMMMMMMMKNRNIIGHEIEGMEMDSEISKRMLYGIEEKKYISYGALKNEAVPCSTPGAPYYNCHGGAGSKASNTYTRGCQVITRCARDASNHP